MQDSDDFLRRFAVEIANALREREDGAHDNQRRNHPSIEESVEDLYRALIFDEPLVNCISDLPVVASSLSQQFLRPSSGYALSNRLVNGVVYLCNQNATVLRQKQWKPANDDSVEETHNLNGKEVQSHSAIQIAMSKLLFCLAVDIPLECCRDNSSSEANLEKIRRLLGSFKGNPTDATFEEKYTNENTASPVDVVENKDPDCNVENEEKTDAADVINNVPKRDPYAEEVWAAESDPSDYDYGEGDSGLEIDNRGWNELQQMDGDWLDPNILSKADPNLTLQQTRDAIGSLVQLATYTLLEPIFCLSQKDVSYYISKLTQLILVLLQPRKQNDGTSIPHLSGSDSLLLDSSMDSVILFPLWILRDAAMYHSNSALRTTATSYYEKTYLQILQTLLGMDQAHLQDMGELATLRSGKQPDLCVSSIVGLSSLSSWCESQKKPNKMTIDAIVESMNELEHVVHRGQESHKKNIPNTLVPILEVLSGIHYDRVDNNSIATLASYYKSSTIPQTLLNSGFLRQILSFIPPLDGDNVEEIYTPAELLGFHHALWGLCIAYPKIVGKYVFRYPGSPQIIRSYATQLHTMASQNCVQSILWNLYGWNQCKDSSGGSSLRVLRKPGSSRPSSQAPPKLTQDECSEVCRKAWSQLCRSVMKALEKSDESDDAGVERVIQEWGRLLLFVSIPSISTDFKTLIDASLLQDISAVIVAQSEHTNIKRPESPNEDSKIDKDKDDKPSRKQTIISQAHKLLKEYKLFFQGTVLGSSKMD